ncbi:MAG: hypothetical protein C4313_08620 [Thermoflexus sp.]|uniref:hypothetical protein n=1 Tax=Thermoflexus sp. TaxID=1969742 RepID=UPI00332417C7
MTVDHGRSLRLDLTEARQALRAMEGRAAHLLETLEAAGRMGEAASGAVRALPGERFHHAFPAAVRAGMRELERARGMARALEEALACLEAAFQNAARRLAFPASVLPHLAATPLAVDASGRPLPDQFAIRMTAAGSVPWTAACGPVALSMALSHVLGRPIPAQEVADRVAPYALARTAQKEGVTVPALIQQIRARGKAGVYTAASDLLAASQAYGVSGDKVFLSRASPEEGWQGMKQLLDRPGAVIALVRALDTDQAWAAPKGLPVEVVADPSDRWGRAAPSGGVLTAHRNEKGTTAHWVVVDRLEEHEGRRYVVINNPYHNRQERYAWEDFWRAIDQQAFREDQPGQWWVLHLRPSPSPVNSP